MPHLTFLDIDLQDGFWLLYLLWLWTILQFLRNFHLIYSCFNWKKITLQWCVDFCHTTTQISHNYTYVTSLPCTHPIPLSHHRVPGWAPCVIQQLLTSYLFHTWQCTYVDDTFSICPTLSSPYLYIHYNFKKWKCMVVTKGERNRGGGDKLGV